MRPVFLIFGNYSELSRTSLERMYDGTGRRILSYISLFREKQGEGGERERDCAPNYFPGRISHTGKLKVKFGISPR